MAARRRACLPEFGRGEGITGTSAHLVDRRPGRVRHLLSAACLRARRQRAARLQRQVPDPAGLDPKHRTAKWHDAAALADRPTQRDSGEPASDAANHNFPLWRAATANLFVTAAPNLLAPARRDAELRHNTASRSMMLHNSAHRCQFVRPVSASLSSRTSTHPLARRPIRRIMRQVRQLLPSMRASPRRCHRWVRRAIRW